MKIINPSVSFIKESNPIKKIELCGRVCYKSESRITEDSAGRFVESIIKSGHTSVLEHSRIWCDRTVVWGGIEAERVNPNYGFVYRTRFEDGYGVSMNARDFIDCGGTIEELSKLEETKDYMTVRFICDRGISHELVRHRMFSFSQESTRYVKYNGDTEFVLPVPFDWAEDKSSWKRDEWSDLCARSEKAYHNLISGGVSAQEARSVLPNSLKTEVVMTGTFEQWNRMLKLRIDKAAHPQMRYLMEMMVCHEDCPVEISSVWKEKCIFFKD